MLKDLCFEIIQTCPNHCLFCSSISSMDKHQVIDYDLFKKTIDYFMSIGGIEEISISGGEPFLHPQLFDMIRHCKMNHIRTVLFTSGIKIRNKLTDSDKEQLEFNLRKQYSSYLSEGMPKDEHDNLIKKLMNIYLRYDSMTFDSLSTYDCHLLKDLGLDKIVFDFQAWNQDIYNQIMGSKDSFQFVTLSMIKAKSSGIVTDAHFIPTKINYKELPDIIEMLNVANFDQLSILNFVPQGRGKENERILSLNEEEFQEFMQIYEKCKKQFDGILRVGIPLQGVDSHKCTAGYDKLVIKYDGTVLPCPAFKEYDVEKLNALGIKTPNIYDNLEDIKIYPGTRKEPLCKQLYKFYRSIQ